VDNVCRQVIERHLVRNLSKIFSPDKVAALTDEELRRIAVESSERVAKRTQLRELYENLKECFHDLRR